MCAEIELTTFFKWNVIVFMLLNVFLFRVILKFISKEIVTR